jgi:hypothetical protein
MEEKTEYRILTREEILDAPDIEERTVPVPAWGGAVRIRTLSQKQSRELRAKAMRTNQITKQTETDNDLLESLLFIEGVIEPKFTMADYGRLQDKSMAAMSAVLKAIMDASGLSEDAVKGATKSDEDRSNGEV